MSYKPSCLYNRDYTKLSAVEQQEEKDYCKHKTNLLDIKSYNALSVSVRHNLSLFPNNLIVLSDMKKEQNLKELNQQFDDIIHKDGVNERDILNFINHTPAYHVVGSVLKNRYIFGHHECYLFKEFWLGATYRVDYLIIGKGSGGYEFVFVEFEKPDGRITLKDGHSGEAQRKGEYQIEDWKAWVDGHFAELTNSLNLVKGEQDFPEEFTIYDSSRMHYVVVAGLRKNYNKTTYRTRRIKLKKLDIHMIHYDNLLDNSNTLLVDSSF